MSGAVWLASYPKSGNTWARLALRSLYRGGEAIALRDLGSFGDSNASHEMMDRWLQIESGYLTDSETEALRPDLNAACFGGDGEPRLCKVHDAWVRTPDGRPLFDARFTHATIYQVRDPRDIAVSWAHFIGCSLNAAIERLANPDARLTPGETLSKAQLRLRTGSWSLHVTSWIDESGLSPVVIRYEDMLADPAAAMRRMAGRIGWNVSAEALAIAVESTRFDRLADQERRTGFECRADQTRSFFRSGKAGAWRQSLSRTQAARIEHDHGETMARFGYL